MKPKQQSGIQEFLAKSGILEHGSAEQITEQKRVYWKAYRNRWKHQKKKKRKLFTIDFSFAEFNTIQKLAQIHHRSVTRYVRESCLAYGNQTLLLPNEEMTASIHEKLTLIYHRLCDCADIQEIQPEVISALHQQLNEVQQMMSIQMQPYTTTQLNEET